MHKRSLIPVREVPIAVIEKLKEDLTEEEWRGRKFLVRRERAERSLYDFLKLAWRSIEPHRPFVRGWHLEALCDHLEALWRGEIRKLLVNVPPRTTKSLTCCVAFPAWVWIHQPGLQWLFTSYSHRLSIRDSRRCRDLIRSPWYQERWGNRFRLSGDSNTLVRFDNTEAGYRIATSVDSANLGEGGDILVFDDPNNRKEAFSDAHMQGVIDWYNGTMSTRVQDAKTARRLIIQQRIAENDLSGHILDKQRGDWVHLMLPMRCELARRCMTVPLNVTKPDKKTGELIRVPSKDGPWEDPREVEDELLCEERFGEEELADLLEDLETWDEAGQLQQRPSPPGGGTFDETAWGFYYRSDLPETIDASVIFWDLTFKGKTTSAYNVGQLWVLAEEWYWLIDFRRKQCHFRKQKEIVLDFYEDYPWVDAVILEDAANAAAIHDELIDEIPVLDLIPPKGDKILRAEAIGPDQAAGKILLPMPEEDPRIATFLKEANTFPNSAYKDQVDTMSGGVRYLKDLLRRRRSRRRKPPRRRSIGVARF